MRTYDVNNIFAELSTGISTFMSESPNELAGNAGSLDSESVQIREAET